MNIKENGFTMVELLAVITIMGLLLLITIPSVSRIIENARKDSFVSTASDYLEAVENNVIGDNLVCYNNGKWIPISVTKDGKYFFSICTSTSSKNCYLVGVTGIGIIMNRDEIVDSTSNLFDSIKKSPYGDAELQGYVSWEKKTTGTGKDKMTSINYKIKLQDVAWRGFENEYTKDQLKRSNIATREVESDTKYRPTNNIMGKGYKPCKFK